jgi:hypothetical protein
MMPVIGNTAQLYRYPYSALSPEAVKILTNVETESASPPELTAKILDCYCHILNLKIGIAELESSQFNSIVEGLLGALRDEELISSSLDRRRRHGRTLLTMASSLGSKNSSPITATWDVRLFDEFNHVWQLNKSRLCESSILYWNGWPVVSRKNKVSYLDFSRLWHSHGREFSEETYAVLKSDALKRARPLTTEMNALAGYLSSNADKWNVETFQDPILISEFFEGFMLDFFSTVEREGRCLATAGKAWRDMIIVIEEIFIKSGRWAKPEDNDLPKPLISGTPPSKRNLITRSDGRVVNNKMMTEVPIDITDDEAISILFKEVEEDISIVKRWAKSQAATLRKAHLRSVHGACAGIPLGVKKTKNVTRRNVDDLGVFNIYATFESEGFTSEPKAAQSRYGYNLKEVAEILGLPTNLSLFPFQCLLVIENASITGSFLEGFKLYDKNNKKSGFLKTDAGYMLVGYKDRRGKKLSEQKIPLSPRAAAIVRQVEQITQPLRDYLKKKGDPKWRELFLTCGKGFAYPISANTTPWTRNLIKPGNPLCDKLVEEFMTHTNYRGEKILDFIKNVTLSKLRASCGVSVYLKTQSVNEMAKALGHHKQDGRLLGSYLNEAIEEFFEVRWVRIFQRAIVCEAMKSSVHFTQSAGFKTISELDNFLTNHALKAIPSNIIDPEGVDNFRVDSAELYISIDEDVLTSLVSIERAVINSGGVSDLGSKALYWAKFSKLLAEHIESMHNSALKTLLKKARQNANASTFEHLIYAAAQIS